MEHYNRVKRLKHNTLIVFPSLKKVRSKTELFLNQEERPPLPTPSTGQPTEVPLNPQQLIPAIEEYSIQNTYQKRVEKEALAWERSRESLIDIYFSSLIPGEDDSCSECHMR